MLNTLLEILWSSFNVNPPQFSIFFVEYSGFFIKSISYDTFSIVSLNYSHGSISLSEKCSSIWSPGNKYNQNLPLFINAPKNTPFFLNSISTFITENPVSYITILPYSLKKLHMWRRILVVFCYLNFELITWSCSSPAPFQLQKLPHLRHIIWNDINYPRGGVYLTKKYRTIPFIFPNIHGLIKTVYPPRGKYLTHIMIPLWHHISKLP